VKTIDIWILRVGRIGPGFPTVGTYAIKIRLTCNRVFVQLLSEFFAWKASMQILLSEI